MGIPDDVLNFLRKRAPKSYCDECIAGYLDPPRSASQVQPVTATLALTSGFYRARGACELCIRTRLVTSVSTKKRT